MQNAANPAFVLIRAVATNVASCKHDGSPAALVSLVRSHAKAAFDLGKNVETHEEALGMVGNLERISFCLAAKALQVLPQQLKECRHLVGDALVLKADLLAGKSDFDAAIATLGGTFLRDCYGGNPNLHLMLAGKALRYGGE